MDNGGEFSVEQVITRYETVLRELIRSVLGPDWHAGSSIDLDELTEKRAHEAGIRRGATVSDDLLDYVEHRQLGTIIRKRWQEFAGTLGERKRWDVYVDRIADLRNAPMHGRTLLLFERQLLSGMTGEISNIVAQHRSSQGPDAAWYPVIESVVDSFGNAMSVPVTTVPTRLRVGETVVFTCTGRDPQDRDLHRVLSRTVVTVAEKSGSTVDLEWNVQLTDVSERTQLLLQMRSSGEYHREGTWDYTLLLEYKVSPPGTGAP